MSDKKGMSLAEAKKLNKWGIIPLSKVPDNTPVFAVQQYPNKAMAEFQLVEECIVPYPKMTREDTLVRTLKSVRHLLIKEGYKEIGPVITRIDRVLAPYKRAEKPKK